MNKWRVKISKEAEKDYDKIDGSVKKQVLASGERSTSWKVTVTTTPEVRARE